MTDYSSQTVAQLKELLKQRNLAVDGKKADLVQRLIDNENNVDNEVKSAQDERKEEISSNNEAQAEPEKNEKASELTLTVIQPQENNEEEKKDEGKKDVEEKKSKNLSPEERKQLAVDLLTKKVQRAEKFGEVAAAEAARKDLARVEKFGVEPGTALAREIGLVDRSLSNGFKKNFKGRKNFKSKKFKKFGKPKFNE